MTSTPMKLSSKGEDLIKGFEGLYLHAYQCIAGKWTISWGVTEGVTPGMKITPDQAEAMFQKALVPFEAMVNRCVTVTLTQHEYDSCVSIAYNIGLEGFETSSLLKVLNLGMYGAVPAQMLRWDHYTDPKTHQSLVSPGLLKRRTAEGAYFLDPDAKAPNIADPMPQIVNPPAKVTTMATAPATATPPAATVPASSGINLGAAFQNAINSATTELKSLYAQLAGLGGSAIGGLILHLVSTANPGLITSGQYYLGMAAFALSGAAHLYSMITGAQATNNATLALAENWLNKADVALGGTGFDFDNGGAPSAPATA